MPKDSNQGIYIIGDQGLVLNMHDIAAVPFDEQIIDYLDRVSKLLLRDTRAKRFPEVVTFAFWCRKASIMSLKKPYEGICNRIGRGTVFHIAPSNVPVNFAYSLVASLLAGNANIVRVPSKEFEQVVIICEALKNALDDHLNRFICLVRYGHDQSITDYFSALCDIRIIWGGDKTISEIRKSPIKPRTTEIAFSDRYSICVIDADAYLNALDKNRIAADFYNDTYLTDQNACTSPKLIVWMGEGVKKAQDMFWSHLYDLVKEKYSIQPAQVVSKYTNLCRQAIKNKDHMSFESKNNLIMRVQASIISPTLIEDNGNSGYFIEYNAKALNELLPICSLECQTLSYFGLQPDKIKEFIFEFKPKGIDRVVPIGKTMDFSLVWDGHDLIYNMTREICIM